MPYTSTHKRQTRKKIIQSASKLFSQKGFDQVSINDLMTDAGLTRGAFYNHFNDKSSLYSEAIIYAALKSPLRESFRGRESDDSLQALLDGYLSQGHVRQESIPCPLAFLVTDVSHRNPQVRSTYTQVYRNMIKLLTRLNFEKALPSRETLMAVTAMMVGAVAMSRALDDETIVDELLAACRTAGATMLEGNS